MSKDQTITIPTNMLAKLISGKNFIQGEPCNIDDKGEKEQTTKGIYF